MADSENSNAIVGWQIRWEYLFQLAMGKATMSHVATRKLLVFFVFFVYSSFVLA